MVQGPTHPTLIFRPLILCALGDYCTLQVSNAANAVNTSTHPAARPLFDLTRRPPPV